MFNPLRAYGQLKRKDRRIIATIMLVGLGVAGALHYTTCERVKTKIAVAEAQQETCLEQSHSGIAQKVDLLWTFWSNVAEQVGKPIDSLHLIVDNEEYEAVKRAKKAGILHPPPKKGYFFFNYESGELLTSRKPDRLHMIYMPPEGSDEEPFSVTDFDGNGITKDKSTIEPPVDRTVEARLNRALGHEDEHNRREEEVLDTALALIKSRYGTTYDNPTHEFRRCVF